MQEISYELKRKCAELANAGTQYREIYETVFHPEHAGMGFEAFRHKIRDWRKKNYADDNILESASLNWGFTPYAATVQTDGAGHITQAWVKQSADTDDRYQRLIEAIEKHVQPVPLSAPDHDPAEHAMLEIPLFDMHMGINNLDYYTRTRYRVIRLIESRRWEQINIIIGQDLFHNDDFMGRTSKGTQIEQVDIKQAWEESETFWVQILTAAAIQSDDVRVMYSPGNHDESMSWAFCRMLERMFPSIAFDIGLNHRKCISWRECFIGICHGSDTKSNVNDLRGQFTIKFPVEFAQATVREIHTGHLHHEVANDTYGVMVRRLSTDAQDDKWSDDCGYIGQHKRFQVFEWEPGRLSAVHYV